MRRFVLLFVMVLTMWLLISCDDTNLDKENVVQISTSETLNVLKVENIPNDFIMGMDVSSVLSLESSGVKFYDYDGMECDVFKTLASSGINYIRVRVWNNPFTKDYKGYGGGNCDINNLIAIGKRANKYGMKLLVDFHYSDFWADPSKQMVPKAWLELNIEDKCAALYSFTKDSLVKLKENNIDVGIVQVGNETNGMMCGESSWSNITKLMRSGIKACREILPSTMVALHFTNPEIDGLYDQYAFNLKSANIDYDIFASSYYPFWHGSLENLANVLNNVSNKYNKKVMIVETSYPYTSSDTDFFANTISSSSNVNKNYPYTILGQATAIRDLINCVVNDMQNGIGVCYWEGAWISVGTNSYDENYKKWETYGSGWASSYAMEYDPSDAGKWYGGCSVDNQALFNEYGKPLESLKIFNLVKNGNIIK